MTSDAYFLATIRRTHHHIYAMACASVSADSMIVIPRNGILVLEKTHPPDVAERIANAAAFLMGQEAVGVA